MSCQRHKTGTSLRIVLFSPNRHFSWTKWQRKRAARLVESRAASVQVITFLPKRVLFERRELVSRDNVVATHGISPPTCVGMLVTVESRCLILAPRHRPAPCRAFSELLGELGDTAALAKCDHLVGESLGDGIELCSGLGDGTSVFVTTDDVDILVAGYQSASGRMPLEVS